MSISINNRLFFFLQGIIKYNSMPYMSKLRVFLYSMFFNKMGENVKIMDGTTFKFPDEIIIDDNVNISEGCYIVGKGGLTIGKDSLIGSGTKIITTLHNFEDQLTPIYKQGITSKPIFIMDDVWIGFNVIILPGVTISKGAVIGANSVVNRNIPPYAVALGYPISIIKYRK